MSDIQRIVLIGDAHFNRLIEQWFEKDAFESVTIHRLDWPENTTLVQYEDWSESRWQGTMREWEATTRFGAILANSDLVIETLTAPKKIKQKWIQAIGNAIAPDVPFLCSILHHSATEMSSWNANKGQIIGYHPFHFHELNMLELAPAIQTNQDILHKAEQAWESFGKKPQLIKDQVGGIFPRTLALLVNEACFALEEGVANAEDIDIALKKGTNYPLGPLEWADRVGVHHVYAVLAGLHRDLGEDRYRPAPLLQKKVWAEELGIQTQKGFYHYA